MRGPLLQAYPHRQKRIIFVNLWIYEDLICFIMQKFVIVNVFNNVVVGSSHRDMPKYMGEGVASCGLWANEPSRAT